VATEKVTELEIGTVTETVTEMVTDMALLI
jgi:hypothetical protein